MSSSSEPSIRRASARQAVALGQQHDVAGHERATPRTPRPVPSRRTRACGGRSSLERLGRALGLQLLREGERRVQQDHGDDRRARASGCRWQRQRRRDPQQQRERVRRTGARARAAGSAFSVRVISLAPNCVQPPLRLARGQAFGACRDARSSESIRSCGIDRGSARMGHTVMGGCRRSNWGPGGAWNDRRQRRCHRT